MCSLEVILGFIMTLFFARDEGALLTMPARSSLWGFSGYLFFVIPHERELEIQTLRRQIGLCLKEWPQKTVISMQE